MNLLDNSCRRVLSLWLLGFLIIQCNNSPSNTVKCHPADPFIHSMVESQFFDIDLSSDGTVIEADGGTRIVCPKGCFTKLNGDLVGGPINVELAEALTLDQMILSNLTTSSEGKLLETDGMIYLNVTSNGEQLLINKEIPVYIQIPTEKKKSDMMVYQGTRDEKGNMNWIEPKELNNYLVTVDMESLDFLPEGFRQEVEKGMPYKNHKSATRELVDSLYFSQRVLDGSVLLNKVSPIDFSKISYSNISNAPRLNDKAYHEEYYSDIYSVQRPFNDSSKCGIDPAIIKVLKSEEYANTLIATKEFEARLKVIFKTCNDDVLRTYVTNLDKNLFELDSLAVLALRLTEFRDEFEQFYIERLTNVKDSHGYEKLLRDYFDNELGKVKLELQKAKAAAQKEEDEKKMISEQVKNNYREILRKREKYSMETYGFIQTETGWINIDRGTIPKDFGYSSLGVVVSNAKNYDRVHSYIIFPSIKSLVRLNESSDGKFYAGSANDPKISMPKSDFGISVSIGYKDGIPSFIIKEFLPGFEPNLSVALEQSSRLELESRLNAFNSYSEENQIETDLHFMEQFNIDEKHQEELKSESEFLLRLWNITFPCCASEPITVNATV